MAARRDRKADDVAIVRLEQISPFPYQEIREELTRWPNAQLVWAQEEAMNYGAWSYVRPRLETTARSLGRHEAGARAGAGGRGGPLHELVTYVGRNPSAAPATGLLALHLRESEELLEAAFGY